MKIKPEKTIEAAPTDSVPEIPAAFLDPAAESVERHVEIVERQAPSVEAQIRICALRAAQDFAAANRYGEPVVVDDVMTTAAALESWITSGVWNKALAPGSPAGAEKQGEYENDD